MKSKLQSLAVCLVTIMLGACGNSQPEQKSAHSVAVTTIQPKKQTFHHSVYAWGEAVADSRALQHLSMAHGGLISALPVSQGQAVEKGQDLLRMSTDPAALRNYQQAQNALTLARSDLARNQRLAAQHLATEAQLAAAQKAVADAKAALQAERAMGATRGTHELKAPAAGVVTALHVGVGDRVAANAPLLDFSPAHALVARLGVQPDQSDGLQPDMPVQLKPVYGDRDPAMGHVDMVGRAVDPKSGMVPVRVIIPSPMDAQLIAGSAIEGSIHKSDVKAWAVPRESVLKDDKGHYLFQVMNKQARRVAVTVEQPDGTTLGVTGNIKASLPVVVMGAYELSDGDTVRQTKAPTPASAQTTQ